MVKQGDNAQHDTDVSSTADFSNRLTSAQSLIALREETILTFSNSLNDSQSASLACSNQLLAAQSTIALGTEQITNLNQQVAEVKSENQKFDRRIMDLTNQIAGLTKQIALTEASLAQTNKDLVQAGKDYVLLENRFRIDVAERTVMERKFDNLLELQAQIKKLKKNPAGAISEDSIYAGLNVEVKSNGWCHVITPN